MKQLHFSQSKRKGARDNLFRIKTTECTSLNWWTKSHFSTSRFCNYGRGVHKENKKLCVPWSAHIVSEQRVCFTPNKFYYHMSYLLSSLSFQGWLCLHSCDFKHLSSCSSQIYNMEHVALWFSFSILRSNVKDSKE